jgi:hypothetical protein
MILKFENVTNHHLTQISLQTLDSWVDLHANKPESHSIRVVHSLGYYILSGATMPRRSNAFTSVILNEFTIQRREFSNASLPNSKTLTFS